MVLARSDRLFLCARTQKAAARTACDDQIEQIFLSKCTHNHIRMAILKSIHVNTYGFRSAALASKAITKHFFFKMVTLIIFVIYFLIKVEIALLNNVNLNDCFTSTLIYPISKLRGRLLPIRQR